MPTPSTSLAQLINRTSRALTRHGDAALSSLGLRYAQVPVLALLTRESPQTQKALAAATGIEQASMAQLISRMERDGLLTRAPHPDDRRSQAIALTAGATALATDANDRLATIDRAAVAGLTPAEVETLVALLTRVKDNLAEV